MNILSVIGSFIITFALLSYGISTISIVRFKVLTKLILFFITLGIVLDVLAVVFMISGSDNSPFGLHGIIGYSAFLVMASNGVILWREFRIRGLESTIRKKVIRYTKYAYLWWLIIYFAGSIMILW